MVTESGDLVVLAVQRHGEELAGRDRARGRGHAAAAGHVGRARGAISTIPRSSSSTSRSSSAGRRCRSAPGAKRALVILAAMVILLATGAVPPAVAGLLAAGAHHRHGRARRSSRPTAAISWTTVILVAGMIPLSTAMTQTGAAAKLADGLVDVVGDRGPHALLLGLFVLTAVLGQLISNMATALIVIPIAISAAAELDVSPRPVLMARHGRCGGVVPHAGRDAGQLMVMEPGGYRFGDYWKLGLPLLVAVRRRRRAARARHLGVLSVADERRPSPVGDRPRRRGARSPRSALRPQGVRRAARPAAGAPRDGRRPARPGAPRAGLAIAAYPPSSLERSLERFLRAPGLARPGVGVPLRPLWLWALRARRRRAPRARRFVAVGQALAAAVLAALVGLVRAGSPSARGPTCRRDRGDGRAARVSRTSGSPRRRR